MNEPIYVTRPALPPYEEFCEEIKSMWDTGSLTNGGPKCDELESKLASFLGVQNAPVFNNGHLALETAIEALGLTGEVITTPFTFVSTTMAIINKGLRPVFCDIEDRYFTMDAALIEPLINEKTSAIIPVHIFGNMCDVDGIGALAKKHGLKVIYDAAHAFGVKRLGIGAGNFGDISAFSLNATKVFHTFEGGCLTFGDPGIAEPLKQIRQYGLSGNIAVRAGTNAKMTEIQAAMGLCNLNHIGEYIQKRKTAFGWYNDRLEGIEGLVPPGIQDGCEPNYSYYPIRVREDLFGFSRDEVFDTLCGGNVFAKKYFFPLVSSFDALKDWFAASHTPAAERASGEIIVLPMSAEISESDVDRICGLIRKNNFK